jgi:hypothetical protein
MTKFKILIFTLFICISSQAQDVIIKRNGDEIKSKVLEVALTIIKYKKYDNLSGPTFEILKSDVFMIKYENGTRDVINALVQNEPNRATNNTPDRKEKEKSSLAFTSNHRSTTIAYGVSAIFGGITNYGDGESDMVIGPLLFSFDKALSDKFSIAFRPAAMYYQSNSNYFSSSLLFGGLQVRVDYHFATTEKLDPYFGLGGGLGYFFGGKDLYGIGGTYPIYGGGFGIKSYGKGRNALLVELGYDSYSYLKIGYVLGKHK